MDGVITNTMPDHFKAWKTILKGEGLHVSHHDVYIREGQKGIMSVRELFSLHKRSYYPKEGKEILKRKEKLFKKIAKTRFISGARSFLRNLHRQNFKLALVTGTSRQEVHKILPERFYELFDVIVTGSDVKKGKPHPEPFLLALQELKLYGREVVVIENAPLGIESARKAGLKVLAIETSLPKDYLKKANWVFASIKDLRDKIQFVPNGQRIFH